MSEENLGASSGGGSESGSGHKKLILKRESCSCDSGDRVSEAGSRRSKSIGERKLVTSQLLRHRKQIVRFTKAFLQRSGRRNMKKPEDEYSM